MSTPQKFSICFFDDFSKTRSLIVFVLSLLIGFALSTNALAAPNSSPSYADTPYQKNAGTIGGRITGLDRGEEISLHLGFLKSGSYADLLHASVGSISQSPLDKGETAMRFSVSNGQWQLTDLSLATGIYHLSLESDKYVSRNGSIVIVVLDDSLNWRYSDLDFELLLPQNAKEMLGVPLCNEPATTRFVVPQTNAAPTPTPDVGQVDPEQLSVGPEWPLGTCYAGHFLSQHEKLAGIMGTVTGLAKDQSATIEIFTLPPQENELYSQHRPPNPQSREYRPPALTPLTESPQYDAGMILTATLRVQNGRWGFIDPQLAGKKYLVSAQSEEVATEPAAYQVVVFDSKFPDVRNSVNFVASNMLPYYASAFSQTRTVSNVPPRYLELLDWNVQRAENASPPQTLTTADIPEDICLPASEITVLYSKTCARKIEQFQIENGLTAAVRKGRLLELFLTSGETLTLTDTVHTGKGRDMSYIRYVPELNAHLLHAAYNEGLDYLLVDAAGGEMWRIPSPPIISPDGKHFITMYYIFQGEIDVLIWEIGESGFSLQQTLFLGSTERSLRPNQVRWDTNQQFSIEVVPDGNILLGAFQITLGPNQTEPIASFVPVVSFDDTLILYTTTHEPEAEPIEQMWGLYLWPRTKLLNTHQLYDMYARLAYGERFALAFLGNRPKPSLDARYLLASGLEPRDDLSKLGKSYSLLIDLQNGTYEQARSYGILPTWSPTSKQFAYVHQGGLFVQDVDLKIRPKLRFIHKALSQLFIKWSPDGKWIAVTTHHQGEPRTPGAYPPLTEKVWLVPADNGVARELAEIPTDAIEHAPQELQWSSDSQYIVFQGHVLGIDGTNVKLEDVGIVSDWLPKEPLLLASGRGLRILNPQGEQIAQIAEQSTHMLERAFSRSGMQLAYTQHNESNSIDLFVYDLEQESNIRIGTHQSGLSFIQWSADDKFLLFDDYDRQSPIWAIPVRAYSTPQVIIKNGLLIDALPLPDN